MLLYTLHWFAFTALPMVIVLIRISQRLNIIKASECMEGEFTEFQPMLYLTYIFHMLLNKLCYFEKRLFSSDIYITKFIIEVPYYYVLLLSSCIQNSCWECYDGFLNSGFLYMYFRQLNTIVLLVCDIKKTVVSNVFLSSTSVQLQHQNQYCSVYYKRVYFDNTMFWTMHSDSFFVLGCIL